MVSIIKIQFKIFIFKNGVIKISGFIIPSATSIVVTIDKKINTPRFSVDLI
jgi:hypothetical protein